ncbi:MAG: FHA domain-containing protein [Myxococcales bacterium]|nr:FHA domain-containing protein [Myxococcales bacterium]
MLPLIIEINAPDEDISVEMAFTDSPVRIGRNPLNDVVLSQSYVSQWHALVEFDERFTCYRDLGSTNGTLYKGGRLGRDPLRVPSTRRLDVAIGDVQLGLVRAEADALLEDAQSAYSKLGSTRARMFARPAEAEPKSTVLFSIDVDPGEREEIARLVGPHRAYRRAWRQLLEATRGELARAPAAAHELLDAIVRSFPEVTREPEFIALAEAHSYRVPKAAGADACAAEAIDRFTRVYKVPAPRADADIDALFHRLSLLLETFCKSFVELRKGQQEFGAEMAVRTIKETTRLSEIETADALIEYLLDWSTRSERPIKELVNAFADQMIHQVALVNGLMEGARSLLRRVGPDAIARHFARGRPGGVAGLLMRLGLVRDAVLWRQFKVLHKELLEEEVALTAALFGRDFARGYAAIGDDSVEPTRPVVTDPLKTLPLRAGRRSRG